MLSGNDNSINDELHSELKYIIPVFHWQEHRYLNTLRKSEAGHPDEVFHGGQTHMHANDSIEKDKNNFCWWHFDQHARMVLTKINSLTKGRPAI